MCLILKLSQMQYDYRYSMNGCYQVITGVEINRKAATQGATSRYNLILINAAA